MGEVGVKTIKLPVFLCFVHRHCPPILSFKFVNGIDVGIGMHFYVIYYIKKYHIYLMGWSHWSGDAGDERK